MTATETDLSATDAEVEAVITEHRVRQQPCVQSERREHRAMLDPRGHAPHRFALTLRAPPRAPEVDAEGRVEQRVDHIR